MEEQVQGGDIVEPPPATPSPHGYPTASPRSGKVQQVLSPESFEFPKAAALPATPVLLEKKSPLAQSQLTATGQPKDRPSAEEYGYIVTDQK